jgi:threonine dehydratase
MTDLPVPDLAEVLAARALGAEVVFSGRDFDEAREYCEKQATTHGYRTAFELPQRILRELLDDFVLVSEDALRSATRLMIEKTRNLVEPAGAGALAAVLSAPGRFAGRKVAIVCSGGNISPAQLAELWPSEPAAPRSRG